MVVEAGAAGLDADDNGGVVLGAPNDMEGNGGAATDPDGLILLTEAADWLCCGVEETGFWVTDDGLGEGDFFGAAVPNDMDGNGGAPDEDCWTGAGFAGEEAGLAAGETLPCVFFDASI